MGLNNLENKIRENKKFFDEEPLPNHLERFQKKLSRMETPKAINKGFLFGSNRAFAVAASISILVLVAILALLEFNSVERKPQLSEELLHVKMYYNQITEEKMNEIENYKGDNKILYETTENRLQKLDNTTQELEQKLGYAQGNKQLENAYIQSLQAKSEIVNQIYNQINTDNTNINITQ